MPAGCVAVLDIGGTKTTCGYVGCDGVILAEQVYPTLGPQATLPQVLEWFEAHPAPGQLHGTGIACGNPMDAEAGLILRPNNLPLWDRVQVVKPLEDLLRRPAWLENDANAGALAEWKFGAGQGCRSLAFLTCGTGQGAGLILDGRLYRGCTGDAGEVGHVRIRENGLGGISKPGSLEQLTSGGGLTSIIRNRMALAHPASSLDQHPGRSSLDGRDVGQAALTGDEWARELIREAGENLGRGLAILMDVLNLECIVLGAMAQRLGELLLEPARRVAEREALPATYGACRVVVAQLGDRLSILQGACIAFEHLGI